jgi:DNA-binding transcriptional LysR family regulator
MARVPRGRALLRDIDAALRTIRKARAEASAGTAVEAQLRRLGALPPNRFECSTPQTLMAMVAAGAGWTITTPLLVSRARKLHSGLGMHPFAGKSFVRTLSLLSTVDCAASVIGLVESRMRGLIHEHAIAPLLQSDPWLGDSFRLIE